MRKLEGRAAELELGRIENDPATAELAWLRSEAETLHEEQEKQAKLVAGIAHQRDLYRALIVKNDAPLVEGESGQALIVAEESRPPLAGREDFRAQDRPAARIASGRTRALRRAGGFQ